MENKQINRMLINATQKEEMRVALTVGRDIDNVFIEKTGAQKRSNIYKGKITRVVPSLQACFVDFGQERHGFLPLKEISQEYFNQPYSEHERPSIQDVVSENQEIMIQVEKEERGNKGAALTTFITLAGSYLVLLPNNPKAGGISRRIEGEDREQLREFLDSVTNMDDKGLIVRTAGVGKSKEELQWDLDVLMRHWQAIQEAYAAQPAPFLILQESDIVTRAFRDYLRKDIDEIIIDNAEVYEKAKQHINTVRPEFKDSLILYKDPAVPLFTRYQLENQIETAYQSEVRLPSGGSLVIEATEAMVTVDVNSAQDTKGGDIEATALNTNREAAIEIARQLRLRDIGGLIVVDFIDMLSNDNQNEIVNTFYRNVQHDKARVQFSRISKFGLLEISRQRLRPSLMDATQATCPRCSGQGSIRSTESLSLFLLRIIREDAMQKDVIEVQAQLPIDVATFILNEKRHTINDIERHHNAIIRIIPNHHLETPHYKITKVKAGQEGQSGQGSTSYKLRSQPEVEPVLSQALTSKYDEPAIKYVEPPEKPTHEKNSSVVKRLWQALFTAPVSEEDTDSEAQQQEETSRSKNQRRHHNRNRQGQQKGRGRNKQQSKQRQEQEHTKKKGHHYSRGRRNNKASADEELMTNRQPAPMDDTMEKDTQSASQAKDQTERQRRDNRGNRSGRRNDNRGNRNNRNDNQDNRDSQESGDNHSTNENRDNRDTRSRRDNQGNRSHNKRDNRNRRSNNRGQRSSQNEYEQVAMEQTHAETNSAANEPAHASVQHESAAQAPATRARPAVAATQDNTQVQPVTEQSAATTTRSAKTSQVAQYLDYEIGQSDANLAQVETSNAEVIRNSIDTKIVAKVHTVAEKPRERKPGLAESTEVLEQVETNKSE